MSLPLSMPYFCKEREEREGAKQHEMDVRRRIEETGGLLAESGKRNVELIGACRCGRSTEAVAKLRQLLEKVLATKNGKVELQIENALGAELGGHLEEARVKRGIGGCLHFMVQRVRRLNLLCQRIGLNRFAII